MDNHLIKQLDREVDSLRDALANQVDTYNFIIDWLEGELEVNLPIVNGDLELSDGSTDIYIGRSECAESLLKQLKKWEKSRNES